MSDTFLSLHPHYKVVTKAIFYLNEHSHLQPNLKDLSNYIGLSEHHLQRVFSEWAGVSPKQFLQYLTKEYAKQKLRTASVLETALAVGLSGTSRLHDLLINWEGMTPGEYKKLGQGLSICYGMGESPFGMCFIATTSKGICKLAFVDSERDITNLETHLHAEWNRAFIIKDDSKINSLIKIIFNSKNKNEKLKLLLKGSPFQFKVWEALLAIPEGELVSYQTIANSIQLPKAVRAIASAVARNNIAYIIPCHRVIRQTGEFGEYRWDSHRKQALIAWEGCKVKK